MSVWQDPFYVLEAAHSTWRMVGKDLLQVEAFYKLLDFDIRKAETYDHGWAPGNLAENVRNKSVSLVDFWGEHHPRDRGLITAFMRQHDRFRWWDGYAAMCRMVGHFWDGLEFGVDEYNMDEVERLADEVTMIQGLGSYQSPRDLSEILRAIRQDHRLVHEQRRLKNSAMVLRHALVMGGTESHKRALRWAMREEQPLPEIPRNMHKLPRHWSLYRHRNMLWMVNSRREEVYAFNSKQVERLARQLEAIANVVQFFAEYQNEAPHVHPGVYRSMTGVLNCIIDAFRSAKMHEANYICRAFDVAYHVYLAGVASDLDSSALRIQRAKFRDEGLDRFLNLESYLAHVHGHTVKDALNLLKAYKLCMPTDMDQYVALDRTRKQHRNPNVAGNHHLVNLAGIADHEDFWLYSRWNMIYTLWRRDGTCPGRVRDGAWIDAPLNHWSQSYPEVRPTDIPFRETSTIDLWGVLPLKARGIDYIDMLKNKKLCPSRIEVLKTQEMLDQSDSVDRSYILRPLRDVSRVEDDLKNLTPGSVHQQVAFKPEAKKPSDKARCFFSSTHEARKAGSWVEEHIAELLPHKIGTAVGQTVGQFQQQMRRIAAYDPDRPHALRVSFDIAGMSPQWSEDVRRRQYDLWQEVFGEPNVRNVINLEHGAWMHLRKMGVNVDVRSEAWDYEGQHGRANTWFHTDLMAYCVHLLREMGLVDHPGRFLCQIDDGVLALFARQAWTKERVARVKTALTEVYAMEGWEISWDKTYLSSNLAMYLNEVYYLGHTVTSGVKAYLRMTTRMREVTDSLPDVLGRLDGYLGGAIKSGSFGMCTYRKYVEECIIAFLQFYRDADLREPRMAYWFAAPTAVGGAGLRSYLSMVSNVTAAQLQEYVGLWRQLVQRDPKYGPVADRIFDPSLVGDASEDWVADPGTIRYNTPKLSTVRTRNLVKRYLLPMVRHPMFARIGEGAERLFKEWLTETYQDGGDVRAVQAMWDSSPFSAYERMCQKLDSPDVLRTVLPRSVFVRLCFRLKREVKRVVKSFIGRLY